MSPVGITKTVGIETMSGGKTWGSLMDIITAVIMWLIWMDQPVFIKIPTMPCPICLFTMRISMGCMKYGSVLIVDPSPREG